LHTGYLLDFSPSPQPSPIKGEGEVDLISTSLKKLALMALQS
jgi:hypothetical protein